MIQNSHSGFTLIELLLVVAISAVAVTAGFVYLGGYRSEQNLKLTANEVLSAVKNTQALSKSQQDGKKWGIRFTNPTSSVSTGPTYSVFSGTSYAAGTVSRTYPLGRNISFTNPSASSTIDLIFNALTGYASQNQIISLVSGRGDGLVNDITMNTLGQITSRFDTGLVGYWHFDEATSTPTYDASGYGNTGTLTNGPTWQTGTNCKAGVCLSLDGISNYVSLPNSIVSGVNDMTLMAWVYWNGGNSWQRIFDIGTGTSVNMFLTPKSTRTNFLGLEFAITTSGGDGEQRIAKGSDLTTGVWKHVAVVLNGDVGSLYEDGAMIASSTITLNPSDLGSTTNDWIGRSQYVADSYFSGRVDEARIYNRALSATEISDIYNSAR